jgi:hypothetical protein
MTVDLLPSELQLFINNRHRIKHHHQRSYSINIQSRSHSGSRPLRSLQYPEFDWPPTTLYITVTVSRIKPLVLTCWPIMQSRKTANTTGELFSRTIFRHDCQLVYYRETAALYISISTIFSLNSSLFNLWFLILFAVFLNTYHDIFTHIICVQQ